MKEYKVIGFFGIFAPQDLETYLNINKKEIEVVQIFATSKKEIFLVYKKNIS